jgi:cytochrome o ubiquinol oxidase subunit 1
MTFAGVAVGGIALVGLLTYFKVWGVLWRDWLTSVDHKKIGIMYVILALVMLLRGFADALMMRIQQASPSTAMKAILPPHHYDQIFTAHGVIMIFFVAMPFVTGLMNYVVPLQIGARDVSFPFLNNFSFWMTVARCDHRHDVAFRRRIRPHWLAGLSALSGIDYSPDVGVDYYIWGLQVAGVGTTLSGINLIATIVKMRAPGMTDEDAGLHLDLALHQRPDRRDLPDPDCNARPSFARPLCGHEFLHQRSRRQSDDVCQPHLDLGSPGGLHSVLPAFGIFSEVVATFSGKRLFGYASMVYATCCHHHPVLSRLAAPLLHHGRRCLGQRLLRHHDDDHLDPHGREDVQLALHNVSRPHPL